MPQTEPSAWQKLRQHFSRTPKSKNWGKRIAIGGIAVVTLASVGVSGALSQGYGGVQRFDVGGGHGGPDMHMQTGLRHGTGYCAHDLGSKLVDLDITPEQEEELAAITDQVHNHIRLIKQGLIQAHNDLAELLSASTLDPDAVEEVRAEIVEWAGEALRALTTDLLDATEVLTAEQLEQLLDDFGDLEDRG
ncbi:MULTISPECIES: periplasmic heavy metal sensor [Mesorhizobium]|nr:MULTISPECIES: periplasmic heavy metal sensor [Mesorhizobium]TPJ43748.1 periplasmic heavy metal sensor [Mesorhizobium sp. B2-6-6]ARP68125.1 hypothetical protein A9K65_031740 [Mesorhizobium sp. WSM1497]MCA0002893.1 periplasmic heavy metal sensor [Mesorhizobium sp. B264B2A]MCA0009179.1 periplasmic heavy metal sensor [Mesorhizobium sp. B264B1B]MCA0014020.1 periplasmic heavy metal sensor [Mesorhizobium sp. B294B1A1]